MGLFSQNKFNINDIKTYDRPTKHYIYKIVHKKTHRFYIGSRTDKSIKKLPDIVTGAYNTSSSDQNFKNEFKRHKNRFTIMIQYFPSRIEANHAEEADLRSCADNPLCINKQFHVADEYLYHPNSDYPYKQKTNYSKKVGKKQQNYSIFSIIATLFKLAFKIFIFVILPIAVYLAYLYFFIFTVCLCILLWLVISLIIGTSLLSRIVVIGAIFLGNNLFLLGKSLIQQSKFSFVNNLVWVKKDSIMFSIFTKQNYYFKQIYCALKNPLIKLGEIGNRLLRNKLNEMRE